MKRLALALACAAAGCATMAPRIDEARPAYWVWREDGLWRVRATGDGRPHRFQGTVVGVSGSIGDLAVTEAALADRVALNGGAVHFDFDAATGRPGFDFRVAGGCARFDLMLDGKRRAERIYLGGRARPPARDPFERCP